MGSAMRESVKFTIEGTMPGLNEMVDARMLSRRTRNGVVWNKYSALKREVEARVAAAIKVARLSPIPDDWYPVTIHYEWVEPHKRRDKDNIRAGSKFILDALALSGILAGDGWKHIENITDTFDVDKARPRVVVRIGAKS